MRTRIAVELVVTAAVLALWRPAFGTPPPQPVPEVVSGFAITPLMAVPAPTALAFGPGGPDLYVATLLPGPPSTVSPESTSLPGQIVRISLLWTPAGPVPTGTSVFATGFTQPLGVAFDQNGNMYVSDSHPGAESGRTDGRVTRLAPGQTDQSAGTVIVDGLPNGRHNTNHLRFGPDSRLSMPNGNPNDAGCAGALDGNGNPTECVGGDLDVFPYSGAILSVDAAQVSASPAILHWKHPDGTPIQPVSSIPTDPINADFAAKVTVLAHGFRNIFGVAFAPAALTNFAGTAYTGMNGSDGPASQDVLFKVVSGANYGFPFCFNDGAPGAVNNATTTGIAMVSNPNFVISTVNQIPNCSVVPTGTALLGWHVCATGIDFPIDAQNGFPNAAFPTDLRQSVFVGECTPFFLPDLITRILADPARPTFNTGHKVVRVELDAQGNAVAVNDFVTGLVLNTDVLFGPDGAMYIADAEGIFRVAPAGF